MPRLITGPKMTIPFQRHATKFSWVSATVLSALLAACGGDSGSSSGSGNVAAVPQLFAQTNDTNNAVLHFLRNPDGSLTAEPPVPTGGKGTNGVNYFMGNIVAPDALTSNNSVIVSQDGSQLFVANAGDNTVSVFTIGKGSSNLTLLATSPTGGIRPTSLAYHNGVLYVTHQQGAAELGAYRVGSDGKLTNIGQYVVVQQDALPSQVTVSPDGKFVVVNGFLKSVNPIQPANMLLAFPINPDGTLGASVNSTSVGVGPFGGRFGNGAMSATFVVSDAAGGTVSSYSLQGNGNFAALSGPLNENGQAAPCWVALTPDNRFAFISNGSGTVSSFSIDGSGKLTLLNAAGGTEPATSNASTSSFANDSWISPDGHFLYQDYAGDDKIVVYSIGTTGTLTKVSEQPVVTQSQISLQGMAGI
jgi:6-phosphogluconolactonase